MQMIIYMGIKASLQIKTEVNQLDIIKLSP